MSEDIILLTYLGKENYNKFHKELISYKNKIILINKFNIHTYVSQLINIVENLPIKLPDDINITYKILYNRVQEYFNRQRTEQSIRKIKCILKYQHIISIYCFKIMSNLIKSHTIKHITEISSMMIDKDYKIINSIIEKYLESIKITYTNPEAHAPKNFMHKESELLSHILTIILELLLKYENNQMICYGSYTCHNLDPKLKYNDIDLYHLKAYKFCIFLMTFIYFVFDIDVYIFCIPFIPGHMSIKYKTDFLIDCIFLPKNIIELIPKILLNNINFINPGLQMLNNIRMGVEMFRSYKIYKNIKDIKIKYNVLLNNFISGFSVFKIKQLEYWYNKKVTKESLHYKFENNHLIIDLKYLIPNNNFDKIIVSFNTPNIFIENVKSIKGMFSRRYHAFLNEIFFETEYVKNIKGGAENTTIIDTEKIQKINRKTFNSDFVSEYENSLIMTNLMTSIFVKSENGLIVDISYRNMCSIFATVSLYLFLHKREKLATEMYYVLLSMISNINEDISEFMCIDRYKIKGDHKTLSIKNNLFMDVYTKDYIDENFLTYDDYISTYANF
jgi:hypothetical protein